MERGIVVVPGARIGPYEPLLCYAWLAARARGAEALHIAWTGARPRDGAAEFSSALAVSGRHSVSIPRL